MRPVLEQGLGLCQRHGQRVVRLARRHRLFTSLLAGALAVRLAVMAAYHPALYFYDTYEYVGAALRPQPYVVRPSGYSILLLFLEPFHSLRLVVLLQHLMGLAIGVIAYALLRRYSVHPVAAAAAASPQLFDAQQIELEHLILSETLFTFLTVVAVALLLWRRGAASWTFAAAGAAFGAASLTRVVGLPLALAALGWLLVRRTAARNVGAFAAALVIPLLGYAGWFQSYHGSFEITGSSGVFLYSRTMSFADCSRMDPPPDLRVLCTAQPRDERWPPSDYIWHPAAPLQDIQGPTFSPYKESLAMRFALRAVVTQPLDYARVVAVDFGRTFGSRIADYPTWDLARHYRFRDQPVPIPDRTFVAGGSAPRDMRVYERGDASPRAEQPLVRWLVRYQKLVVVPGPVLGLLLFAPLGVLVWVAVRRWRAGPPGPGEAAADGWDGRDGREGEEGAERRAGSRAGSPAAALALVVAAGFVMLVVPPMTAGFDYRYVPPALPFLGVAGALAVRVVSRLRPGRSTSWPTRHRRTAPAPSAPVPRPAAAAPAESPVPPSTRPG